MKWQATSTSSKAFLMQFVDIFWVDMWLKGLRSDIKRWEDFLFVSILLKCLKNTNFENVWVSREIILLFRLGTFKSSAMMSHQWKIFKPSLANCQMSLWYGRIAICLHPIPQEPATWCLCQEGRDISNAGCDPRITFWWHPYPERKIFTFAGW